MVYGLWFMVWEFMIDDLWFMVYGLWFMIWGFMVYGFWCMISGLWFMISIGFMVYGL